MRPLLGAAIAAALVLGARGASAQTLGNLFPPLATEVAGRLGPLTGKLTGVQKKQKSALTTASKALAVETDDVGKTIADAVKAVSAIEKVFAADPTLPAQFDPVVQSVVSLVTARRTTLDASIAALPDGKKKAAVQKSAIKADAADALFTAATTRAARLKALQRKFAAIVAGEKVAAKAGVGIVATISLDVDVERERLHLPGLQPFNLAAVNVAAAPGTFQLHVFGGIGETRRNFSFEVSAPGTGPHEVAIGPGSTYSVFPIAGPPLQALSGTVNFTTWDPDHGKVAATFSVTYSNGTNTVHLTNGKLVSIDLQNQ